jgi:hypothetical protein
VRPLEYHDDSESLHTTMFGGDFDSHDSVTDTRSSDLHSLCALCVLCGEGFFFAAFAMFSLRSLRLSAFLNNLNIEARFG